MKSCSLSYYKVFGHLAEVNGVACAIYVKLQALLKLCSFPIENNFHKK